MHDRGIAAGDRIVVQLQHSKALYLSFLGALKAGLVPSYFAPPSPKQRKEDEARTFAILLQESQAKLIVREDANDLAMPSHVQSISPRDVDLGGSPASRAHKSLEVAPCFIQYSSGTTGLKKAVAVTDEMLLSPKSDVKSTEREAKDIIFVLDTSGSMSGEKIDKAKAALRFGVDSLFEDYDDAGPLLSRCTRLEFASRNVAKPLAIRAKWIAEQEGLDGRPLEDYIRLVNEHNANMRAVLNDIEAGCMLVTKDGDE